MRGGVYEQAGAGRFIGAEFPQAMCLAKCGPSKLRAPAVMGRAYGPIGGPGIRCRPLPNTFGWLVTRVAGSISTRPSCVRTSVEANSGAEAWPKREQHGIIAGDQRVETGWAVPCNARPALDCDADLRQCGDVGIYRGRRQDRAVIAKQPLKRTRAGFENRYGLAFHGEVERRGQPREPRAHDGNALRLPVGLGRAANAGVGVLNTRPFQGRDADRSAGLALRQAASQGDRKSG